MNKEILEKLLEYIDARIDEKAAVHSCDAGLIESIRRREVEEELSKLCKT